MIVETNPQYLQAPLTLWMRMESPAGERGWWVFDRPVELCRVERPEQLPAALAWAGEALEAGEWVAGWLSYESAPGCDAAYQTRPAAGRALAELGRFTQRRFEQELPGESGEATTAAPRLDWKPALDAGAYHAAIEQIRAAIAAGETYQVNYTFPLEAPYEGSPLAWFRALEAAAAVPHSAWVAGEDYAWLSLSPELFFAQEDESLVTRPMKGTAPRGRWFAEDEAQGRALAACPKNRAENVMIVDLLRNDLGRVARPGTVEAGPLFTPERYPTLWQLTSTVRAKTDATPPEVLAALFPCGSITGAPKVQTMRRIAEWEIAPRGIYTGSIGWMGPDRQAHWNVAIRTLALEGAWSGAPGLTAPGEYFKGRAVYGVGSGVTWGSDPAGEYEECQQKAAVLGESRPHDLQLLETMRWERGGVSGSDAKTLLAGIRLWHRHRERLMQSAAYWGFTCDMYRIERCLSDALGNLPSHAPDQRLRLTIARDGEPTLTMTALDMATSACWDFPAATEQRDRMAVYPAVLSKVAVDSASPYLYHKTTHRACYEQAQAAVGAQVQPLLRNERGELSEFSIGNLAVTLEGEHYTPPLASGVLPGTLRGELIDSSQLQERVLIADDLGQAQAIWLLNSVRGICRIRLDRRSPLPSQDDA